MTMLLLSRLLRRTLAFAAVCASGAALAQEGDEGGLYLGVATSAAFYDVDYSKAVDSRDPGNQSANAGRILSAESSADATTWDAGVLVGYRLGGSAFLDIEADLVTHRGEATGRMAGAGASPNRNQLGEVWPEDWSLAKERSYGLTLRLGAAVPALGSDIYVFGGVRRLAADFRTAYIGCLSPSGCAVGELTSGREQHDEEYDVWVVGAGVEKAFGSLALRGELRYADHGSSERTVPFDEVAVTVPVELATGELGLGVGLIWRP